MISRVRFPLAVSVAIAITMSPPMAFADPALDELKSVVRSCVRAHAQEAESAGVSTQNDADKFFQHACDGEIMAAMQRHNTTAMPPGSLRIAAEDEWKAITANRQQR
jgi:hypothetical protein